ncbi:unnamed protein product [Bemisia tabaci]|uniref:Eukaryotic translation initiation factor 3 subunit B n=1 Tax=Bemisia tabaci TaxID=7038 RepID=A0A9P0A746_BEMTA|nr:PREDICTED: eukaryotic translation initiation factor 3 subunit B [Bemisia tabaci]CAH0385647.1 unnamed protein product [Bemisia tabaci]
MAKKDKAAQQEKKNEANENEEPNFSDEEGFVDRISDQDLLGDILAERPKETDGVESIIVVDKGPRVEPEKLNKFKSVINSFFSEPGQIVSAYYPVGEDGKTKGYFFLEYASPTIAQNAVSIYNNAPLDKNYTFAVNPFTDFKKYEEIPAWEPPTPEPYKPLPNLQYWLLDPDAFDQYIVRNDMNLVQVWHNTLPQPQVICEKEGWTETYVQWSPLGTYLVTFHKLGVILWGGPEWERIMRFHHPGAQFVDFSPCEQYMVTYSPQTENVNKKLIIFDIRSGAEMRSFSLEMPAIWPIFRWSKDDKYFARITRNLLSIYETPSFGLLDKKSINVSDIKDFSWSPTDNILAYWVAESKDGPARVVLMEVPSRKELRTNNVFNVADCKIHWQKSGDYLCVKVDRYSKIKKEKNDIKYSKMYYNLEIFHMREKLIPVDSIEIKEQIHAFAWEPVGSKFAIVHGEPKNVTVSFYNVKTKQDPVCLKKFEKRTCSHLFWSPHGQFIVLAQLLADSGALEFVDTNDFASMNTTEHFNASEVEWDPTGRYIFSGVPQWKSKIDTGYWIWSFQGKILKRYNTTSFVQFAWRPRPPTLLSPEQLKDIKKNLKKYTSEFEQKDRTRMTKASKELIEARCKLMDEFKKSITKRMQRWKDKKKRRLELRNHVDTDDLEGADAGSVEEESIEFLIKVEEIPVE